MTTDTTPSTSAPATVTVKTRPAYGGVETVRNIAYASFESAKADIDKVIAAFQTGGAAALQQLHAFEGEVESLIVRGIDFVDAHLTVTPSTAKPVPSTPAASDAPAPAAANASTTTQAATASAPT